MSVGGVGVGEERGALLLCVVVRLPLLHSSLFSLSVAPLPSAAVVVDRADHSVLMKEWVLLTETHPLNSSPSPVVPLPLSVGVGVGVVGESGGVLLGGVLLPARLPLQTTSFSPPRDVSPHPRPWSVRLSSATADVSVCACSCVAAAPTSTRVGIGTHGDRCGAGKSG
jgi:hypothetical protein